MLLVLVIRTPGRGLYLFWQKLKSCKSIFFHEGQTIQDVLYDFSSLHLKEDLFLNLLSPQLSLLHQSQVELFLMAHIELWVTLLHRIMSC